MTLFLIYLVFINIFAFLLMGIDKKKAKTGAWRISERNLFLSAVAGGSVGAILGMQIFRHKTKHWYFRLGMPAILIIQAIFVFLLLK